PGLFSTMTGCPRDWVSFSATRRARMSVEPPGAQGTTILTGFSGQAPWAASAKSDAATAIQRLKLMGFSPCPGEAVRAILRDGVDFPFMDTALSPTLESAIAAAADRLEQKVVAWRRDIHQNPELGNREFRTSKL